MRFLVQQVALTHDERWFLESLRRFHFRNMECFLGELEYVYMNLDDIRRILWWWDVLGSCRSTSQGSLMSYLRTFGF